MFVEHWLRPGPLITCQLSCFSPVICHHCPDVYLNFCIFLGENGGGGETGSYKAKTAALMMEGKALLCHGMVCYVMSCYVISCHFMSCYVMSCYVMSGHELLRCSFGT